MEKVKKVPSLLLKNLYSIEYILIFLALAIAFVTRLFAAFQYITFDIGPDPDQIRDTFIIIEIWDKKLPLLGPSSSIGGHHLMPLYYYLVFPFTLLGKDPVFQVLFNALFSFLSVPLFIYLIYKLLEKVNSSFRLFLSAVAGVWYSLLFSDIFISNYQWNPSSIPFFFMVMTLLYKQQMESKKGFLFQSLLWGLSGLVIAILLSLHSSTLFIIPIVFIITSTIFISRAFQRKNYSLILMPLISILSSIIFLTPYWISEFRNSFENTKKILKTIMTSSSQSDSAFIIKLLSKLYNLFFNYFKLGQQSYFWNGSWLYLVISIVFLSVITYVGVTKFRGNRHIWLLWISTWIIFLLAAANIDANDTYVFYKSLILFAPIVFTVSSLAYQNYSLEKKKILTIFLGLMIVISCLNNISYDYRFLMAKYGKTSLMSTEDVTHLLEQIPPNSTICDPRIKRKRERYNKYNYIDTYVTRKRLETTAICQAGNYVIHPKRIMQIEGNFLNDPTYTEPYFFKNESQASVNLFPTFTITENEMINRPSELFYEIKTAYVYRLK